MGRRPPRTPLVAASLLCGAAWLVWRASNPAMGGPPPRLPPPPPQPPPPDLAPEAPVEEPDCAPDPHGALLDSRRRHPHGAALVIGANAGIGLDVSGSLAEPELWWNDTLFGQPYRKVLVEPVPPIFAELQRNMRRRGPPNVTLINAAVGPGGGELTMHCWALVEQYPSTVGQLCSTDRERVLSGWSGVGTLRLMGNTYHLTQRRLEAAAAHPSSDAAAPGARRLLASRLRGRKPKRKDEEERQYILATVPIVNYTAPLLTVPQLLQRAHTPLGAVRYVQIDVEGADLMVLQGLPFGSGGFRPRAVVWEQRHLSITDRSRAYRLLRRHGYTVCPLCDREHAPRDSRNRPLPCTLDQAFDAHAVDSHPGREL
eukprot:TRINITY_DN4340_c2_g1_i1.p1 TRINITY_DN4340_c2_g1~~TRINITY_DN4340_c2_g1_i1.p1  ORF type:complete len:390 (+),score=99.12 TRINITY_DN4340_c2_g1_i1:59-1171(+)